MGKVRTLVLIAGAILALTGSGGCYHSGAFFVPIPVPPWVAERMEEKYCFKNDRRTPIMPPIREGFPPPLCEDPRATRKSSGLCRTFHAACRTSTRSSVTIFKSSTSGWWTASIPAGSSR